MQERPNLSFPGKVTRTSSSLDAASRTLLTEVQVDNPTGVLLPGMYALIQFIAQRADPPFLVPGAALVVRASGTMLAVLQPLAGNDCGPTQTGGKTSAELPACEGYILSRSSLAATTARSLRFWKVCMATRKWWWTLATR